MRVRFLAAAALAVGGFAQPIVQGPVVLIIGPPGAGKTTQADVLSKAYGLPAITAEQLITANPEVFERIRRKGVTGIEPETDPVLNRLFEQRIAQPDAAKGFITAGYPSVKDHADFVAAMVKTNRLPNPIVVQLEVPEAEVRKRLARDPKYANLDQLMKDYQREMAIASLYFPNAEVHRINGRGRPNQVTRRIRGVLDNKIGKK
jgi:adenylate kinase